MKTIAIVGGLAALGFLLWHHTADASPAPSNLVPPGGWTPPSGATFTTEPAGTLPFETAKWQWRQEANAGGQQAGKITIIANKSNPQADWVVVFQPDAAGQQIGVLAMGTTQTSGLLAQAAAAGVNT